MGRLVSREETKRHRENHESIRTNEEEVEKVQADESANVSVTLRRGSSW